MLVKIKDKPNQDYWYRNMTGETFIVKQSEYSDLIDVDGIDKNYPENYYVITTGNHKYCIISKKDAIVIDNGKEVQTFKECCIETRAEFVNAINKQNWNTEMRTAAEDLLIVYDQMMSKLSNT